MSSALEDIKSIDLNQWLTLATAPSPTKLQPGQTPYAFNTWVDEKPGSVITANGFVKVGQIPSGNPPTFCINYFKTSSGTQTFVVSDNATVWTTIDFQTFTSIITGLSQSFQLRGAVIRDKLWLTNGNDSVRTFDGTSVVVLDGTGGTPNVPKGRYIAYHDERVWIGHISSGRSECFFSALTDASGNIITPDNASAWPNANFLQISEGDADFLTGLLLYRGYLHFFKQYSIWRLVGYDEYTYSRVKTRASTGTRFNESLQILDSLVHLIGVDGIYVFDGEETERISDIIDPATAEQASFGFNQLQQPNLNNLFWETESNTDWNAGNIPQNLLVSNNQLSLQAKDDSQSDFQAGATLTNIDTTRTPGSIQLSLTNSGVSAPNVALNQACTMVTNASQIGQPSFATDGNLTNLSGFTGINGTNLSYWQIALSQSFPISRVNLRSVSTNIGFLPALIVTILDQDGNQINILSATSGSVSGGRLFISSNSDHDITINLSITNATAIRVSASGNFAPSAGINITVGEIQIFTSAFSSSGQFVSRTLDLGDTPASLGNFLADWTTNGETITFQTQSSSDGTTWDAAVAVTNGGAIGSTPRRFFRWIANFSSDGNNSEILNDVWVGSLYESVIHDTGGNIFAWGAFEADRSYNGQTINFYYRGASTNGGVASASWNLIVPGGAINLPTSDRYIQFKIEISGLTAGNNPPTINSVTINWVEGSGTQPQVLQNVASFFWRNRYWLSAAGAGATANNTIIVRGKKTFGSPWQLKDWNILAFTRYLDNFYGTSSLDGSIYQLDTGYSKDGGALNSIFETGDFTFKGFQAQILEIMVEVQRKGPYTLFVGTSIDQGQTWTDHAVDLTQVAGFPFSYWKRLNNLNLTTDKIRLRFFTNMADQPWQVHNCIVYYKMSANRGTIH